MKTWNELTPAEQRQRRDTPGVKSACRILTFFATPAIVLFTAFLDFRDSLDREKETRFRHVFSNAALNLYEGWRWSITGRGGCWLQEW